MSDSDHELRSSAVVVPYLREHGPTTFDEFPVERHSGINPETRRRYGVRRLIVRTSNYSKLGRQTPVYYIESEHDFENVVRRYLEANDQLLDETKQTLSMLFGRAGSEFREAFGQVADEYDLDSPHGNTCGGGTDMDCPFCGADVRDVPSHLPCSESP